MNGWQSEQSEKCPACGSEIPRGADRCPVCGNPISRRPGAENTEFYQQRPQPTPYNPVYMQHPLNNGPNIPPVPLPYIARHDRSAKERNRRIAGTFGAFSAFGLLIFLMISLAYLLWSPSIVIPNGMFSGAKIFLITPFPVVIATLTGWAFVAYYLAIVAAITASFFYVAFKDWKIYAKELNMQWKTGEHSVFFSVAGVFCAVLFFDITYMIIISMIRISPATPDFSGAPIWENMYGLANASVWEELITRVLLLGVPLMIYHTAKKEKKYPLKRYFLGGGIEIDNAAILLIIISSSMFGIAHVFSWDIYKILPAAVGGVAFAYVFLKYGLAASIILHFSFDFTSIPGMMSGTFTGIYVALMLLWIATGAIFFVYYLKNMIELIDIRFGVAPKPYSAVHSGGLYYMPPPQYFPPPPQSAFQQYAPYPQNPPYMDARPYPPPYPQYPPPTGAQPYSPPYQQIPPQYPAYNAYYQGPNPQYGQTPPQYFRNQNVPNQSQTPGEKVVEREKDDAPHQTPVSKNFASGPAGHPREADGFVCPSCGYTQARYENGTLVCLRCGYRRVL